MSGRWRLSVPCMLGTEEQFLDVSEKVLSKTSPSIAKYIGAAVWKNGRHTRLYFNRKIGTKE